MNYFDPARPRLGNGLPQYVDANGQGIAALQALRVGFIETCRDRLLWVEISCWLKIGLTEASEHRVEIPLVMVGAFLARYYADPEALLRESFGYTGPKAEAKPEVMTAPQALEDLGL